MKKNNIAAADAEPWPQVFVIAAVLVVMVATGLRFFQIGSFSFWGDELYSIATATQPQNWYNSLGVGKPLSELQATDGFWVWKLSDPHPPLFEMLLSVWISLFGASELAVRGLSALFGVLAVVSAFVLPTVIPKRARILYGVLLAFSGPLLIYSQEARNYVMGICLVAWMFTLALRQLAGDYGSIQEGRPRTKLLVLAAVLMLTHFYGVVMVFSFAAVMTLQARGWRPFLRATFAWLLTLVPIAVYLYFGWQGVANKVGAGPEKALSFAMTFKRNTVELLRNFYPTSHAENMEFWAFLLIVFLAVWGVKATRREEKKDLRFLVKNIASVQLIFFFALALATRRVEFFSARYLVFLIPGSLLLVAMVTVFSRWTQWVGAVLAASLVLGGLRLWYLSPRPQNDDDWRGSSELAAKLYQPGDAIVVGLFDPWMLEYYAHYLRKYMPAEQWKRVVGVSLDETVIDAQLSEIMQSRPPKVVVYAYSGLQDLVVNKVKARWPCELDQWHDTRHLRVGTMTCRYP